MLEFGFKFLTQAIKAGVIVVPCAVRAAAGIKLLDVPQPKPLHGFSPNFKGIVPHKDLELIRFWGESGNNCCHGNTFKIFGS